MMDISRSSSVFTWENMDGFSERNIDIGKPPRFFDRKPGCFALPFDPGGILAQIMRHRHVTVALIFGIV